MSPSDIIQKLASNHNIFKTLFSNLQPEEITWKRKEEKWCLLEILCHLYDEEREDFRTRVRYCLETPNLTLPEIDPVGWVKGRQYMQQDFATKLTAFLAEREASIAWLQGLENPEWSNGSIHPRFGPRTAAFFLHNWLAHDYLHIRQITRLQYDYLGEQGGIDLAYAGKWVLE